MREYPPTKKGLKQFLKELKPGKTYYQVWENGGREYLRTFEFRRTRFGYWKDVDSGLDPDGVLGRYGSLYTDPPKLNASREKARAAA